MNACGVLCHLCNSAVSWVPSCHTYKRFDTWMSCVLCDSAVLWSCESCDWSYTEGLNKNNPRSEDNEKKRPPWIDDEGSHIYKVLVADPVVNLTTRTRKAGVARRK